MIDRPSPPRGVVALAGRRIDPSGMQAVVRFPQANIAPVRQRIARALAQAGAIGLVCSAACGADLIALDVALEIGIRRRIVLPFEAQRFAATSVTDRPGEWAELFAKLVGTAAGEGDLLVLSPTGDDDACYAAANNAILDEAVRLSTLPASPGDMPPRLHAFAVWEGMPRPKRDVTAAFIAEAARRGFAITHIDTC